MGVNIFYGGNYVVAKEVMPDHLSPFGFILLRVTAAGILFLLLHALLVREKVDKQDLPRLFLCGLFGVAVNQLLFFKGLDLTTPINASIMMITTPMLVLGLSAIFLGERITRLKILGIVIGASGAIFIILNGDASLNIGRNTALGDTLVLINAASFAMYLIVVKPLMMKYHPFTVIKWAFLFGWVMVAPFGYEELRSAEWSTFSTGIWLSIGYVIVFATFFTYTLNVYALKVVNPSIVSIYIYSQPVLASIIALSFGKDELTMGKIFGAMLIFFGIYLVSKPTTGGQLAKNG